MHKIRAKDMFFDFLDTVFYIALILFFVFYIFLGGHFALAQQIIKTSMIIAVFIIMALINLRVERAKKAKYEADGMIEDICNYIEKKDLIKDQFVVIAISLSTPIIASFFSKVDRIDILQAMFVFLSVNIWHFYLFRIRDSAAQIRYVTFGDEIADRILVTTLPILMLSLTLFNEGADIIDYAQAALVFGILYLWHKHIFRSKKFF